MFQSYVVYGLRIATNVPVPGLSVRSESDRIDVWVRLKDEAAPAAVFSDLPGHYFYCSPNSGVSNESNLRVGMIAGGKYFGFFYSDGARFAIEHRGREIWADWPEFSKRMTQFAQLTAMSAKIAKAKGMNAALIQLVDIANGCKGCHDMYRQPKK